MIYARVILVVLIILILVYYAMDAVGLKMLLDITKSLEKTSK